MIPFFYTKIKFIEKGLFYSQKNTVEILQKFSPCYDFHELAQQPRVNYTADKMMTVTLM